MTKGGVSQTSLELSQEFKPWRRRPLLFPSSPVLRSSPQTAQRIVRIKTRTNSQNRVPSTSRTRVETRDLLTSFEWLAARRELRRGSEAWAKAVRLDGGITVVQCRPSGAEHGCRELTQETEWFWSDPRVCQPGRAPASKGSGERWGRTKANGGRLYPAHFFC